MSAPVLSRAVLALNERRNAPPGSSREYLLHQLVADLFPDRQDRGYLYRETRRRPGGAELLILSDAPPRTLDEIPVREWGCAVNVQSKPYAPALDRGMALDFEVRVNATRAVGNGAGSKRWDVWDAVFAADKEDPRSPGDVYRAWLSRKLDGAAEVLDVRVTERGEVRARRGDPYGGDPSRNRRILFVAANLVGGLRVTDADRLRGIIVSGVGRAKAFGCGLICLSRPGSILPRHRPPTER